MTKFQKRGLFKFNFPSPNPLPEGEGGTNPLRVKGLTTEKYMNIKSLPQATQEKLEAAAFRQLLAHLDSRKDVQNIDLMNLAGFCRNCLSKWYQAAANEQGIELSQDDVRERIYGMTYEQWKKDYQR
jgi:hypothetical protein